jgi:hypothetical protein
MIEEGDERKAKYWGKFKIQQIAKLSEPVRCFSKEIGEALFNPTLVKIEWQNAPSDDKHEFWFPYWISIKGKERYGQFAPMMGERSLLELLTNAIKQGFFSDDFLRELHKVITNELVSN